MSESIEEFGVAVESLLIRYGTSVVGKQRLEMHGQCATSIALMATTFFVLLDGGYDVDSFKVYFEQRSSDFSSTAIALKLVSSQGKACTVGAGHSYLFGLVRF